MLECVIPILIFLVSFLQMSRYFNKIHRQLKLSTIASTEQLLSGNSLKDPLLKRKEASRPWGLSLLYYSSVYYLTRLSTWYSSSYLTLNCKWTPIFQVTVLLRYSNALINPILYSFTSAEFRKKFRQIFKPGWPVYGVGLCTGTSLQSESRFSLYKRL